MDGVPYSFQKGRYNVLKIVSLAIGLAVGLLLLAQVFFERSFESSWPDADRLYVIADRYSLNQEAEQTTFSVSGGVPAGVKAEIPGVEDVIRYTPVFLPALSWWMRRDGASRQIYPPL